MMGKVAGDEQVWLRVLKPVGSESGKSLTPSYALRVLDNVHRVLEEKTDEQNLVQDLNTWERTNCNFEAVGVIKEAKILLERRNKHQNLVEATIADRKTGSNRISASTPALRNVQKEKIKGFREVSLYNKQFEQDMLRSYKVYLVKLEELGREREELRNEVYKLGQEMVKIQAEIENYKLQIKNFEKDVKKIKVELSATEYFSQKTALKDEMFRNESRCVENLHEIERKIVKNKKIIENLDKDCAHTRKELVFFKESLLEHFKKLLKEGKDSRSEGLQWAVKEIWKLGETVSHHDFALFLSEEIVESILTLAEKTRELEELTERDSKKNSASNLILPSPKAKLDEVHKRLAECSKKLRIKKPEFFQINNRKSMIWENCIPSPELKPIPSPCLQIQSKLKELRDQIERTQEEAVQKAFKSCYFSSHRKPTDLNSLLSCIVGIDNLEKFQSSIIRMKRELEEKLSQTKTFKFSSHSEKLNFLNT